MINNTEKGLKHGQMVQNMRAIIIMGKKMELGIFFRLMDRDLSVNLKTIKLMGMGYTPGPMIDNIKEIE